MFRLRCVIIGTVSLTVLVLHMGIWGVWLGTFLGQTVQALMLYSFIRRPEKEISNYEIRVMSLTFHRTRTWRSPISHRRR